MRLKHLMTLLGSVLTGLSFCAATACVHGQDVSEAGLQEMLDHLRSTDREERLEAVVQLSALGAYAHPAEQSLVELLKSDDQALQYQCLITLGHLGPLARDVSASVASFLKSDAVFLQSAALESLRSIGYAAPEDLAVIRRLCGSSDPGVATAAIRCLLMLTDERDEQVQRSVPLLVRALEDVRAEVRNDASLALVEIGPSVISTVTPSLRSTMAGVRIEACEILGHMGVAAASVVPDLLVSLADQDEQVVRAAATALGNVHSNAAVCVPAIRKLLASDSVPVRIVASRALGEFGPEAISAVAALLPLLKDSHAQVRAAAAGALGATKDGRVEVVGALIGLFSDENAAVTVKAANGLSQIGEAAVPALVRTLKDENFRTLAIEILGPEARAAVPSLLELMTRADVNAAVRHEAMIALGLMGPSASSAAPRLLDILSSPAAAELHPAAAWVLARMGEKKALPMLKTLAGETQDEQTQRAIAWALVTLEPGNPENAAKALPYLTKSTSSDRALVRKESLAALAKLGPLAAEAIPVVLERAEKDADDAVRAEALQALAEIGAPADKVLLVAVAAFSDSATEVRMAARYVLGRLGTDAKQMEAQLQEAIRVGSGFERILSAWALVNVAPSAEHSALALPLILSASQHPEAGIRAEVAKTLGEIGASSSEARQALEALSADDDESVRMAARNALTRLKP
jgi:HEAT repeat protein